jgi:hypothetical protein
MGKMARAGAGIFDKLEPEPHKNGPAPHHCMIPHRPVGASCPCMGGDSGGAQPSPLVAAGQR